MTIQDVIKWCDEKSQDGVEVAICWEGGGDSGWVYMEVDGEQPSAEEVDWLVNKMCDILDYGSWAGEFSANGRAIYDPETKMFEGDDVYSEDTNESLELKEDQVIEIRIPKKYYFEELVLELDNVLDGGGVALTPRVRNGMLNDELLTLCESLQDEIRDKAKDLLQENVNSEYSGWQVEEWDEESIEEAAKEDPEFYVFKLASLDYVGYEETITGVVIDLNEYAEQFNDEEL